MPMTRNLSDLFAEDSPWEFLSPKQTKALGLFPNRVAQDMSAREVAVVTVRGDGGGYATNCACLDYLAKIRSGRCHQAYVVQVDDGVVVRSETVGNVARSVSGHDANQSAQGWGDYWWLRDDFSVSPIGEFGGMEVI